MPVDLSGFTFETGDPATQPGDFVVWLPAGLRGKDALLDALQQVLHFPYFGHNWDALNDLLQDLWWIDGRRIVLRHADLPQLEAGDLHSYLRILASAVLDRRPRPTLDGSVLDRSPRAPHSLVVSFPPAVRPAITRVINAIPLGLSAFRFEAGDPAAHPGGAFVARLPPGLRGRDALFDALQQALLVPDRLRRNWYALQHCLWNLSWIDARRVVLRHADLPQLDPDDLRAYLRTLASAVYDEEPGYRQGLAVSFPPADRPALADLIG